MEAYTNYHISKYTNIDYSNWAISIKQHKQYAVPFLKVLLGFASKETLQTVPSKYGRVPNWRKNVFVRHVHNLVIIKKLGLKRGLDFGCGVCGVSVIGDLLGLDIVGVDIHKDETVKNNFYNFQKKVNESGYPVVFTVPNIYPIQGIDSSSFDFIYSYFSYLKNYPGYTEDQLKDLVSSKQRLFKQRIREFFRLLKPDSYCFIAPVATFNVFKRLALSIRSDLVGKNIKCVNVYNFKYISLDKNLSKNVKKLMFTL